MRSAIGLATGLLAVWWFCKWRIRERQPLTSTEWLNRMRLITPTKVEKRPDV
jgi:hypothetical protein